MRRVQQRQQRIGIIGIVIIGIGNIMACGMARQRASSIGNIIAISRNKHGGINRGVTLFGGINALTRAQLSHLDAHRAALRARINIK